MTYGAARGFSVSLIAQSPGIFRSRCACESRRFVARIASDAGGGECIQMRGSRRRSRASAARMPAVANLCVMLLDAGGRILRRRAVASRHPFAKTQISRKPALEAVVQADPGSVGRLAQRDRGRRGWNLIQRQAADAMDGLSARVVPAVLPGRGTFYRLWVGPVEGRRDRFCASAARQAYRVHPGTSLNFAAAVSPLRHLSARKR